MTYQEVLSNARARSTMCKVCPECNGLACKGMVPGPGGKGDGKSFTNCITYLKNIDIMMNPIFDNALGQNSSIELFGQQLSMPVMGAPCGGAKFNFGSDITDKEMTEAMVFGALAAGTVSFTPDAPQDEMFLYGIEATQKAGGLAVPTIKPWKNERILHHMKLAEEAGAVAICCDVDSAGLVNLKLLGKPVDPKSPRDLELLIGSTKLPFIIKGVMTVKGAQKALEAGAAGIVVSNHGGRVLDDVPATAAVLPAIADAVKGKLVVMVDGGIRSGVDVFKALALGADCVLMARPYTTALYGGGAEGVKLLTDKIKAELEDTMAMCGVHSLAEITREVLW